MHSVTARFKPQDVPAHTASKFLEVTFEVSDAIGMPSRRLSQKAEQEIVTQGVVDSDILHEYWEVWDFSIQGGDFPPNPTVIHIE